ncbi:MAG: hypothetical protein KDA84_08780 [Planctomycetaceae bacterium]|nr:hypothetical protein [Planctomycetaceae bacterium]
MNFFRHYLNSFLIISTVALLGCGGEDLKIAPVSGVVKTLDGEPVKNATVNFTPVDTSDTMAPTSFGKTDEEGRFTLQTASGDKGAFIGKNSVSITLTSGDDTDDSGRSVKNLIPPKYNTESTEQFTVTKEGTDKAEFQVEVLNQ